MLTQMNGMSDLNMAGLGRALKGKVKKVAKKSPQAKIAKKAPQRKVAKKAQKSYKSGKMSGGMPVL
jgi:hypothetical protein